MLVDIAPDVYGPLVAIDTKRIKERITQCMNDIYRTMVTSLLYYCQFFKALKWIKFKINPYNSCVANRLVDILQQYILVYVDYCKLIHKDPKVNDSLIGVLHEGYQSIFEGGSGTM